MYLVKSEKVNTYVCVLSPDLKSFEQSNIFGSYFINLLCLCESICLLSSEAIHQRVCSVIHLISTYCSRKIVNDKGSFDR